MKIDFQNILILILKHSYSLENVLVGILNWKRNLPKGQKKEFLEKFTEYASSETTYNF